MNGKPEEAGGKGGGITVIGEKDLTEGGRRGNDKQTAASSSQLHPHDPADESLTAANVVEH